MLVGTVEVTEGAYIKIECANGVVKFGWVGVVVPEKNHLRVHFGRSSEGMGFDAFTRRFRGTALPSEVFEAANKYGQKTRPHTFPSSHRK